VDAEQQHEERRHQRAAAGAGLANQEADQKAGQRNQQVVVEQLETLRRATHASRSGAALGTAAFEQCHRPLFRLAISWHETAVIPKRIVGHTSEPNATADTPTHLCRYRDALQLEWQAGDDPQPCDAGGVGCPQDHIDMLMTSVYEIIDHDPVIAYSGPRGKCRASNPPLR
jgi:hypothetical protein